MFCAQYLSCSFTMATFRLLKSKLPFMIDLQIEIIHALIQIIKKCKRRGEISQVKMFKPNIFISSRLFVHLCE